MTAVKLLSRIWLPLVILLVLGLGGYAVVRLHGVFGSEKYPTYASGPQTDTKPVNQKQLVYEVFGPEGTVADISYFGNFPYDVLSPIGFNGAYYYARARLSF